MTQKAMPVSADAEEYAEVDRVLSDGEAAGFVEGPERSKGGTCSGSRARRLAIVVALISGAALIAAFVPSRRPYTAHGELATAKVGSATGLVETQRSATDTDKRAAAIVRVLDQKPPGALKKLLGKTMTRTKEEAQEETPAQKLAKRETPEGALRQQRTAVCVVDIIYSVQNIARAGLMIQSAARTCKDAAGLMQKICAINSLIVVTSFSDLALHVSDAVSVCAAKTNPYALCSSAASATVVLMSVLGAGGIVTAAACQPGLKAADLGLPAGATPADLTGPPYSGRRLFLGGGRSNFLGQCVLDFTEVAWDLAAVGLAITSAVRDVCPSRGEGLVFQLTQSACAMDIGSVAYSFSRVAVYISLAMIHCTNELNLQALCSAGISALIAASAAVVVAGDAYFIACQEGIPFVRQGSDIPLFIGTAAESGAIRRLNDGQVPMGAPEGAGEVLKVAEGLGYNISDPMNPPHFDSIESAMKVIDTFNKYQAKNFGVQTEELKKRYKSPEEVWHQIKLTGAMGSQANPAISKLGSASERFVKLIEPELSAEDLKNVDAATPQPARQ